MGVCSSVNVKLIPMKLVMFGWFGAYACASPFMSVHMKALGLTVEETAVVYTMLPITQFLSSPIAGFVADRLGRYRNVLLMSILMIIAIATALLYVPPIGKNDHAMVDVCEITKIRNLCIGPDVDHINHTTTIQFSSCDFQCNKDIYRYSWNHTLELLKALNSNTCQVSNDSVFSMICEHVPSNVTLDCSIKCHGDNITSSTLSSEEWQRNHQLTLYLYTVLRILYNIFSAIGFTLVNSCAIALTETNTEMGEYGRQRLWGMLAMAIFSPLSGILIDILSVDGVMNYAPMFHTHNILAILTGISVWYLDFEMEDAPKSYWETIKTFLLVVRSPAIVCLLLIVFWLGTVWGFFETLLFWFLDELESPTYLLGLTVTIGSLVGIPFLYYARVIVAKLGHANWLSIAVFMYCIRCIGCSFIKDPWLVMPFEVLEIFTYHLMWVAAATYAAHISPPGLLATIQGFIEGIHYGVGLGSGSLLGGILMSSYGSRVAFQIIGGISGVIAVIYSLLHFFWLRKENIEPRSRKASIKSFGSQRPGRKSSSLSADINGAAVLHLTPTST